ncbi:cupin domain-containing protein [Arcobacter roscoffensis]|uniref:Cupin domain-containing protein n=1 Tax=Arcobacter roscoffensis TaxID=2961520 RepID=A0ABY5EA54_9BACT|nr:cupin domain-containing protein [Arcobacter roscoffensis]UTJ07598.1 cupin domain-containing protein [Arcobacter roscoffensis]
MNSDYEKKALIDTNNLEWQIDTQNVFKKVLSTKDEEETSLIKLQKNSSLNQETKINSVEVFVLEGTYINQYGKFLKGTYLKLSKENESLVKTDDNCVFFRKTNHFSDEQKIIIDTETSEWLEGQGNLKVMPLDVQTALVKWPKDEKFIPHKHWGGEEILVLEGIFMDEYGNYPKGSWIRSPHLSEHFPFVKEETIIFVKTGHL